MGKQPDELDRSINDASVFVHMCSGRNLPVDAFFVFAPRLSLESDVDLFIAAQSSIN
jgi:hypothetical protein